MSLQKIFTDGNLVDINVHKWSGTKTIQPEDLGLDSKTVGDIFHLGKKKLIPSDVLAKFQQIEARARWLLYANSYNFEFGSARFVPKKKMPDFVSDMEEITIEFNDAADDLVEKYDAYKIEMRRDYVAAANAAYTRIKASIKGFDKTRDTYLNEFLARIEEFYPPSSDIRRRYSIDYTVFAVSLPDVSQASYADVIEDAEKLKLMKEAYEHSLNRKINSFVDGIITEQRSTAEHTLSQFCKNLQEDKFINESSMESIRKMIAQYESMDIVGDTKLVELMKAFKERLIDGYTAKDLRESADLRRAAIDELQMLLSIITNKAGIETLLKEYRTRVGME